MRELDRTVDIPDDIRSTFKVNPIPKCCPTDHQGRCRARAQSITKTYQNIKNVYVDAATYMNWKDAMVTMIDAQLKENVSASLKNCTVSDAEEVAVALAVAEGNKSGQSLVITVDSQGACRGYTNGRIALWPKGLSTGLVTHLHTNGTMPVIADDTTTGNESAQAPAIFYAPLQRSYHATDEISSTQAGAQQYKSLAHDTRHFSGLGGTDQGPMLIPALFVVQRLGFTPEYVTRKSSLPHTDCSVKIEGQEAGA
ncbi:hypothetical protein HPB51_029408 [Rhipicephalus microplus]|uniref:Uncharacterized protein n=1 Tax=Rhipicephalus microplus TaxID=6941 RepID=A0A9J6CUK8_RHIMP|nr:hypothetical protein HPB51_029408 [Rhipicephalus microplus]